MGLLGRIFGKRRADPPGTYYVSHGGLVGDPFIIRRMDNDKRVGPNFTSAIYAGKYMASLEGGPPFEYPPGAV